MKKISIIIPNYNNGEYIEDCLNSVIRQNYPEKEIIVIDDGSTDDSVEIIKKCIKNNKGTNMRLLQQSNLNAAIARNNGVRDATGDYVLFLDSDDLLEGDVLGSMANCCEKNEIDLVIGGYKEIDKDGSVCGDKHFTEKNTVFEVGTNFVDLMKIKPAPSNKLYNLKLIRENGLMWGNVRIGQDLNFYLKYLSLCKRVMVINLDIYRYRATPNSMTRSFDFRIFDIVNVFEDVKKFYKRHDKGLLYNRYIPMCAIKHYDCQMTKQVHYKERKVRKLIVDYFTISERKLDYSKCDIDADFKKKHMKFAIKRILWPIFISKIYRIYIIRKKKLNG